MEKNLANWIIIEQLTKCFFCAGQIVPNAMIILLLSRVCSHRNTENMLVASEVRQRSNIISFTISSTVRLGGTCAQRFLSSHPLRGVSSPSTFLISEKSALVTFTISTPQNKSCANHQLIRVLFFPCFARRSRYFNCPLKSHDKEGR